MKSKNMGKKLQIERNECTHREGKAKRTSHNSIPRDFQTSKHIMIYDFRPFQGAIFTDLGTLQSLQYIKHAAGTTTQLANPTNEQVKPFRRGGNVLRSTKISSCW